MKNETLFVCSPVDDEVFHSKDLVEDKFNTILKKSSYFKQTSEKEVHLAKLTYKILFSLIYENKIEKYEEIIMYK